VDSAVKDPTEVEVLDWLEDDEPELPAPAGTQLPAPLKTEQEQIQEQLLSIQDEIYRESMEVMGDQIAFREIDPSAKGPPQEWIDKYGFERAQRRFRVASAAWLDTKTAPVALKHITQVSLGIIKARATEKAAPRSLNIAVFMTRADAPEPEFPVIEVEGG
jgi:hypothetical protein